MLRRIEELYDRLLKAKPCGVIARTSCIFSSFGHFRWGGQKSLYGLVSQLDRDLYRPYVVVPCEGELAQRLRELSVQVIVHELPEIALDRAADDIGSFRFLLDVVERYGIDVLHTDGPRNTFFAGHGCEKEGPAPRLAHPGLRPGPLRSPALSVFPRGSSSWPTA